MARAPQTIDALVVSCYELGHQPVAAASALAFLARAGHHVAAVDLAVEVPGRLAVVGHPQHTRLVAVATPMHAALRVACRAMPQLRRAYPRAHVCFFGLYAWLNAQHLLEGSCDSVTAGEAEGTLVGLADALAHDRALDTISGLRLRGHDAAPVRTRLSFPLPLRAALPSVARYALLESGGGSYVSAAIEASRGCLHHCRHCPIPPVYGGRFFVVPREIVLADAAQLVADGVRHLSFADPDFFNGPGHSMAIVRALHERWPELTFDVTTKVENVLEHRDKLHELQACGCLFLVTAIESLDDVVLHELRKGHTRTDVLLAARLLREAGIAMRPSFVPFTPWETLDGYLDLLDWVEAEGLIEHVDPVQYSIRLLVPPGSLLLEQDGMRPHLGRLRPEQFAWDWTHPDHRMERLAAAISALVSDAARLAEPVAATYARIRETAYRTAGRVVPPGLLPPHAVAPAPRLTEPWFC